MGLRALFMALAVGLLCLLVAAAGMGYIAVTPPQIARVLAAKLFGAEGLVQGLDPVLGHVVWDVRLPRILTSTVVGAGLATSGVIFQGLLLNPLADPFTLGVSSGAAFGAALSLLLGLDFWGPYTICLLAFAGAVSTLFFVMRLSTVHGQSSPTTLILAGVIVAAILSAGISFMKYLAQEQVANIIFWLMGSFVARTWFDAAFTTAFVLTGLAVFLFFARDLNIISLGNRTAGSLGVDVRRTRGVLLVTASLVAAACVSVSGIIGFVGLLVPHLMRLVVGPDHRLLLPASALAGAGLLLAADTITRAVLPHEVPIGVLTALIGGPFFCYVFRRKQLAASHG